MKDHYKPEEIRVAQHFSRNENTGNVQSVYKVEFLDSGIFGGKKWYPFTKVIYRTREGSFGEERIFPSLSKAKAFHDNLLKVVPSPVIH